ncbi:hypothetical protein BH20ACT6_BH20ACT6_09390 [soil metagenome]
MRAPRAERIAMPESLRAAAEEFAAGVRAPVEPRDAATVVLLRDGTHHNGRDGPEVYLLRRHDRMAFAAGMAVFPGGGVDDRDRQAAFTGGSWVGPSEASWADQLGCDAATARGLVCAAVRETFEESGVLLAGPDGGSVVADTTGDDWEADRLALVAKQVSLAAMLTRRGLVLRTDLMRAWAHWITPDFEPRRYDTRFFVAVLPAGQRTRDVSTESDAVTWVSPGDALASAAAGELAMMPPTIRTCAELAGLERASDVLRVARRRHITPVEPRLVLDGDRVWLETP